MARIVAHQALLPVENVSNNHKLQEVKLMTNCYISADAVNEYAFQMVSCLCASCHKFIHKTQHAICNVQQIFISNNYAESKLIFAPSGK